MFVKFVCFLSLKRPLVEVLQNRIEKSLITDWNKDLLYPPGAIFKSPIATPVLSYRHYTQITYFFLKKSKTVLKGLKNPFWRSLSNKQERKTNSRDEFSAYSYDTACLTFEWRSWTYIQHNCSGLGLRDGSHCFELLKRVNWSQIDVCINLKSYFAAYWRNVGLRILKAYVTNHDIKRLWSRTETKNVSRF